MPRETRASKKSRLDLELRPNRLVSVAASVGPLASSVKRPSSMAERRVLEPQKPRPSCMMAPGVGCSGMEFSVFWGPIVPTARRGLSPELDGRETAGCGASSHRVGESGCRGRAAAEVARSLGPSGEGELETCSKQAAGDDAPALEDQFGLGAHEDHPDLEQGAWCG